MPHILVWKHAKHFVAPGEILHRASDNQPIGKYVGVYNDVRAMIRDLNDRAQQTYLPADIVGVELLEISNNVTLPEIDHSRALAHKHRLGTQFVRRGEKISNRHGDTELFQYITKAGKVCTTSEYMVGVFEHDFTRYPSFSIVSHVTETPTTVNAVASQAPTQEEWNAVDRAIAAGTLKKLQDHINSAEPSKAPRQPAPLSWSMVHTLALIAIQQGDTDAQEFGHHALLDMAHAADNAGTEEPGDEYIVQWLDGRLQARKPYANGGTVQAGSTQYVGECVMPATLKQTGKFPGDPIKVKHEWKGHEVSGFIAAELDAMQAALQSSAGVVEKLDAANNLQRETIREYEKHMAIAVNLANAAREFLAELNRLSIITSHRDAMTAALSKWDNR